MTSEESQPAAEVDEEPLKIAGPIRRNSWLLIAIAATLIVGPGITRFLKSYRGVILEVREGQMFLAFPELPPDWVGAIDAPPGTVVEKTSGSWNPEATEEQLRDREILKLYERYIKAYQGTVVKVVPPRPPGRHHRAIVQLDEDGKRIYLDLNTEDLSAAEPGRRIEKEKNSWVPILLAETVPVPDPVPPKESPKPETPEKSGEDGPEKAPAKP